MIAFNRIFNQTLKLNSTRLLIVALVYLPVLLLYKSAIFESLELYAYDKLLQNYPAESTSPLVTVIKITEEDINQLGNWPISDLLFAEVLEKLEQYQARVIGFDIYRNIPVQPGHNRLKSLLSQRQNIIAPMKYGDKKSIGIPPPPVLSETEQFGFTDGLVDRDNIVRRGMIYLHQDQQTLFYSLTLRMALMYLREQNITEQPDTNNANYLRLGSATIIPLQPNDGGYVDEDTRGYQFLLDFCKPPEAIPGYTLEQFRLGKVRAEDFKDKIVLVGVVAESVKDNFYTSCSHRALNSKHVSGVMVHAAIVDQLLRIALDGQIPMTTVSDLQEMLWILLWTLIGGFISHGQRSLNRLIVVWLAGLTVLLSVTALLFKNGIWLIAVTPALAWFLSSLLTTAHRATQEKKHRSQLMSLFSKYVAPEIADEIWQKQEHFLTEGRPRPQQTTATVMFTDLQHFTSIAERLEPAVFFDWLNEFLAGMTPLIASHGGVVIHFIGDAIFAGFGIPVPRRSETEISQDAINAVNCALAMNEKLMQLNQHWDKRGLPIVGMRIGLFTGSLATGSVGNRDRMEYTIHGDTVNTAARLEAFDKAQFDPDYFNQPCRILMGGKTLDYLNDQFQLKAKGKVELKGKKERVDIYQVIGKN
ncbi:MAG: adenylate/guanylate cyclase domain-containing protein [Methylococcaceae bacterium]